MMRSFYPLAASVMILLVITSGCGKVPGTGKKKKSSTSQRPPPVAADAYGSVEELLDGEVKRHADDRVDFVSIATPNNTHYPIAKAALEAGFHVVCDKPMT